MEFPYGHHNTHHSHHHQRNDNNDDDDDQERPPPHYPPPGTGQPPPFNRPPPPPYYQENEFAPPPPYFQQHEFQPPPPPYFQEHEYQRPPPPYFQEHEYQRPPPPPQVTHMYHHTTENQQELDYPPPPTQVTHVSHQQTEPHHSFSPHSSGSALDLSWLSKKPTYKVFCKAAPNFHLTIKDGKVVLAPSDPSDEYQNWYKDEKFSTRVKDEVGFPSFALVNKASGQAIKHSTGASHPVQLIPYNPDVLDESVLWSESKDVGDGYRAVRMVNNIRLNLDAFNGNKKSGGVHTGTTIVLWQWGKGENQQWRITPHCKFLEKGHEISSRVLAVF